MVELSKANPEIRTLADALKQEIMKFGGVEVSEKKYWIMFKSRGKSFTAVNPSARTLRVFVSCAYEKINDPRGLARDSHSTGSWGKKFPIVFNLSKMDDVEYAISLIRQAYEIKPVEIVKETKKEMKVEPEDKDHEELMGMVCKIGEVLGFIVRTEESTPDGAYRCDVTWRDYEAHSPLKVFEIEISHRIDHALSSLAHAHDIWRPERLFLIVSDERDLTRTSRLIEPRVKGAFSRISRTLTVYTYTEIKKIFDVIILHEELLKEFSER